MICQICGNENVPGVKFCSRCGSQLQAAQPEQQAPPAQPEYQAPYTPPPPQAAYPAQPDQAPYPAPPPPPGTPVPPPPPSFDEGNSSPGFMDKIKQLPLKKILIIAVPALVLIIAAIIVLPMILGGGSSVVKNSIVFMGDGDEIIVSGNNNPKFTISGEYESAQWSMDGKKAVLLADFNSSNGGTLWYVTTSKSVRISEDVMAYRLSDTGSGVVYLIDYDSKNDIATLMLYNTSNGNSTKITDEAMVSGRGDMTGICISPDGKTVTYISDYDSRDREFTGYMKVGNRAAEKIGKNMYAVAISDNAKHLYYVKTADTGGDSLHVKSGRNENRLISEMSWSVTIWLNKDYSQTAFNHDDRAFFSKAGADRERLYNQPVNRFLTPQGTPTTTNRAGSVNTVVLGVKSLTPSVVITSDGLVHINNKLESNRISQSSDYPYYSVISANGKKLLFRTNNGHLASIDPTKVGADRNEVGRNVYQFVASNDCNTIYFVNEDDDLYYVRGNATPSKVAEDVDGQLAMQWNSTRAFFIVDYGRRGGELFFSNSGRSKTKVAGADEVMGVLASSTSVFFVNYDDEILRSNGNERFTRFAEDIDDFWASEVYR